MLLPSNSINKQNPVNRKEENLQSGTAKVCHKLLAEINFYSLEEEAHIHISNWKEVVKYVLLFQSFVLRKKISSSKVVHRDRIKKLLILLN